MSQPFQQTGLDAFLRDESRLPGHADAIALPRSETDVLSAIAEATRLCRPLTLQGARTGITGGAVPAGGLLLNFSRMDALTPVPGSPPLLHADPGATLAAIRAACPPGWFFPPDPTEPSASIGGMISCNASGARSFRYGPTRQHIAALRIALPDGSILDLQRGRDRADGLRFSLGPLHGTLPLLPAPHVKNAAGYFTAPNMDLLDLFIGAEGTLGIVTRATLRLSPIPPAIWALLLFLPDDATPAAVTALRPLPALAAIEYFDPLSLALLRNRAPSQPIPLPPPSATRAALYLEFHAPSPDTAEASALAATDLLEPLGADTSAAILADSPSALARLKEFRHTLPETVNSLLDERRRTHPSLTKLGTDFSVPASRLPDALAMYRRDLADAQLEHVIFGHIGDSHLHVNILPRNPDDYAQGRALYAHWAATVAAWGGSLSAEHGIGKLKRDFLALMLGPDGLAASRTLRHLFDPDRRLNPGNLFL